MKGCHNSSQIVQRIDWNEFNRIVKKHKGDRNDQIYAPVSMGSDSALFCAFLHPKRPQSGGGAEKRGRFGARGRPAECTGALRPPNQ